MSRRIIITGEHGYIACRLADVLRAKHPDWIVDQISVRDDGWKRIDMHGADAIVHTAGIVHQREGTVSREEYERVNVRLTAQLAAKAAKEGAGQFVFLSSMSVYGMERGRIGAGTRPLPTSLYGRSKLAAERCLKRIGDQRGMSVAVVRPPMVYGPGCPGNYARLSALAKRLPVYPKTENVRSMIYIGNLCDCIRQILLLRLSGTFLPQDPGYINPSRMVKEIAACHGKRCILVPGMNGLLGVLAGYFGVFARLFGTLIYDKKSSVIPEAPYQNVSVREAIRLTEQGV